MIPIAINIMAHELVPDFKILSKKEKESVLKRYEIDEFKLPKIIDTDPVVKTIGAKPGDVLEITRKSATAGISTYYRLVTTIRGEVDVPVADTSDEEPEDKSELEEIIEGDDED